MRVQSLLPVTVAAFFCISANLFPMATMLQWCHQKNSCRLLGPDPACSRFCFGGCLPSQCLLAQGGLVLEWLQLLGPAPTMFAAAFWGCPLSVAMSYTLWMSSGQVGSLSRGLKRMAHREWVGHCIPSWAVLSGLSRQPRLQTLRPYGCWAVCKHGHHRPVPEGWAWGEETIINTQMNSSSLGNELFCI